MRPTCMTTSRRRPRPYLKQPDPRPYPSTFLASADRNDKSLVTDARHRNGNPYPFTRWRAFATRALPAPWHRSRPCTSISQSLPASHPSPAENTPPPVRGAAATGPQWPVASQREPVAGQAKSSGSVPLRTDACQRVPKIAMRQRCPYVCYHEFTTNDANSDNAQDRGQGAPAAPRRPDGLRGLPARTGHRPAAAPPLPVVAVVAMAVAVADHLAIGLAGGAITRNQLTEIDNQIFSANEKKNSQEWL